MALFPSPLERTVASALLLLSIAEPRSPSPISHSLGSDDEYVSLKGDVDCKSCSEEENLSLISSSSNSKSSSVTSDGSSKENRARMKLRVVNFVAREMKFKVARKRDSSVCWSASDDRKVVLHLPASKTSRSEPEENSCISTTTTAASSPRSHSVTSGMKMYRSERLEKPKRSNSGCSSGSSSGHLRHQAEAILKMLSIGSSCEVKIRQELGDSPDTSKALRMLLKKEKIKRSGMGGRCDPYIYKIA